MDALRLRGLRAAEASPGASKRETSCILVWMDGGPTHYETFDPKPDAPKEIRGEYEVFDISDIDRIDMFSASILFFFL